MESRGVAADKRVARDLGACLCFEDEAGQGLRPPEGRTWAPRAARPAVKVRGAGGGRVSIAGVACYRPGDRPHLFYKLLVYRRRKGEPKGFTWRDYRDLILAAITACQPRLSGSGITSTSTSPRSWRLSPRRTRNGCASVS